LIFCLMKLPPPVRPEDKAFPTLKAQSN
jgi:hypothetical protein